MQTIAFTHANLFNGKLDSELQPNMTLLVEWENKTKGTIVHIGSSDEAEIPGNAIIHNLQGRTLIPGWVNTHGHLFGNGRPLPAGNASDKVVRTMIKIISSPLLRSRIKARMRRNAEDMLHSGVTTARMAGDMSYFDVALRDEIESGKRLGTRLIVAGKMICITGGHGAFLAHIADDPWAGRKAVRDCLRNRVDVIKILSTGGVMDSRRIGEAGRPQMTVPEISAVCDEAHRAGYKVMTHCQSTQGIRDALEGGVDSIEHGAPIPLDLVEKFKHNPNALEGYTTLVPTLSACMDLCHLSRDVLRISDVVQKNAEIIKDGMISGLRTALGHDIPLAMGTDASVPFVPQYEFWRELAYYKHFTGVSNKQAINIATEQGAKLLGVDDITGTLEVGKSADFLVLDGNPLEDLLVLENPVHVVSRGNLIKNPTYKKVPIIEQHNADRFFETIRATL